MFVDNADDADRSTLKECPTPRLRPAVLGL
jgi:hypothetical protein